MNKMFKENGKNGKPSSKRIWGSVGATIALIMAITKPFLEFAELWSDTLILGILTASFGLLLSTIFKKEEFHYSRTIEEGREV